MKFSEARGSLVGAVVVDPADEVFSIKASGGVTRVAVDEVNVTGRVTMGVRFISLDDDDTVVAIARNAERAVVEADDELAGEVDGSQELGMTGSSDEEGTAE
jgi:DNA gyrase subunit A